MATDARGHTVPAAGDHPSRSAITALGLSLNDAVMVADTTARATLATAVSATISASRPLLVFRADAAQYEWTVDGTNWHVVPGRLASSYVPVWSSSGTAPVLNNGSLVGLQSIDDAYVDFEVTLTIGSTTTIGTGNYTLTAPKAPLGGRKLINGWFLDSSLGQIHPIAAQIINGSTTLGLLTFAYPAGNFGASSPVAPASGDVYHVAGRYRWA